MTDHLNQAPHAGGDAVGEFDLLAYADGRLDHDPGRRDLVERHLAAHPEEAARVASFQAQNEALRRAGAARLEEPVPDRLLAIIRNDRPRPGGQALKAAAVAAIVAASAGGGWLAGSGSTRDGALDAFAEGALLDYRTAADGATADGSAPGPGRVPAAPGAAPAGGPPAVDLAAETLSRPGGTRQAASPIAWLRRSIAVEIEAPDLATQGYHLADSRRIDLDGTAALRLVYRNGDRAPMTLYLRPRWKERAEPVRRIESGGLTVLHWFDGPLAIALVADRSRGEELEALAGSVRDTVERATLVEPRSKLPMPRDVELAPAPQEARQLDGAAAAAGESKL